MLFIDVYALMNSNLISLQYKSGSAFKWSFIFGICFLVEQRKCIFFFSRIRRERREHGKEWSMPSGLLEVDSSEGSILLSLQNKMEVISFISINHEISK